MCILGDFREVRRHLGAPNSLQERAFYLADQLVSEGIAYFVPFKHKEV